MQLVHLDSKLKFVNCQMQMPMCVQRCKVWLSRDQGTSGTKGSADSNAGELEQEGATHSNPKRQRTQPPRIPKEPPGHLQQRTQLKRAKLTGATADVIQAVDVLQAEAVHNAEQELANHPMQQQQLDTTSPLLEVRARRKTQQPDFYRPN